MRAIPSQFDAQSSKPRYTERDLPACRFRQFARNRQSQSVSAAGLIQSLASPQGLRGLARFDSRTIVFHA